ncbi:hypothetical protein DFQ13_105652 [Actinokineospora spheciospongiae]|nr:hypothetical protein DFQ13_105652 [Actinokineospora spheciospongiae]
MWNTLRTPRREGRWLHVLTGPRTEVWGARYPAVIRLWKNAWAEFVPFPAFDLAFGGRLAVGRE